MNDKCTVLVFLPYYLPGYRAGGPIRSISNLVSHLSDEFNFKIITSDRDINSVECYDDISINQWNKIDGNDVFYLSPDNMSFTKMRELLSHTKYDILYVNSFFSSNFSIYQILIFQLFLKSKGRFILAPRGEFSVGALSIKSFRKKCYIGLAKMMRLYKNITWQASSEYESQDIINVMGRKSKVLVAPNLPSYFSGIEFTDEYVNKIDENKPLKIIFLSRISPMKNLTFALEVLNKVTVNVEFSIYGTKEDIDYWSKCEHLIKNLPMNINVKYCGPVPHNEVQTIFSNGDLYFLPTLGENYGHVIYEALSCGLPVLISDQTPWKDLMSKNLGWDLSLDSMSPYIEAINSFASIDTNERLTQKNTIVKFAKEIFQDNNAVEMNRTLFNTKVE
ncbi:hypothetical protein GCM10008107_02910 [Psychrosphaera saromensis]|uniref:Glycosyl transferase family 1 domain-containing protein n=1 Tax=Psychrosphaera saromensis TaxID=716813 RepID=A0A2S7UXU6_9GAMM|nr:glycosyltransferase [Psychrosphaera saromensis]PQJ54753.1 hypothetical protein BTO11_14575 [Psychrosphaera saromensis]GHB57427.1 hypothetical protein GCM10008107_02910 [Psychrosphaera saromensis]GLQ14013.1 hypothetical protein GCM10007917_14680 [Psychrosphaera saromensis]